MQAANIQNLKRYWPKLDFDPLTSTPIKLGFHGSLLYSKFQEIYSYELRLLTGNIFFFISNIDPGFDQTGPNLNLSYILMQSEFIV